MASIDAAKTLAGKVALVGMVETGTLDRVATVDEVARVVEFFAGPQRRLCLGPDA